jgi:hypothetical protein
MGGDYAAAASALFANVRLPASIVAGVLVPLSFGYVLPREGEVFSPRTQGALIRVYRVLSIWAYVSLVVAIVDASVAINSLAENAHAPAASVADLIASEYQLPWVAMNVNFLFGLCSVFVLVALRALMTWGSDEARVAAGSCAAALLFALSTIDEQVKAGSFADGLPQLVCQYCTLTLGVAGASRSPLLIGGMLAAAGSFVGASGLVVGAMGAGDEAEGGDSTAAAYRDHFGAGQLTTNAVVAEAETLAAAAEPAATEPEAEAAEAAEAATVAEPGAAAPAGDEPTGGC